jgi:hypothetical protein
VLLHFVDFSLSPLFPPLLFLLSTGAKRDELLAADRALAEELDREDRRKIEANSALSYTGVPDAQVTTPVPTLPPTPTPAVPDVVPGVQPQTTEPSVPAGGSTTPPA